MIDPYAHESFAGREGETFRIVLDDGSVDATLAAVRPHKSSSMPGFSLLFVAGGAVLPQGTYTFDHDELGQLQIFVVPVGRGDAGISYEAVFTKAAGGAP